MSDRIRVLAEPDSGAIWHYGNPFAEQRLLENGTGIVAPSHYPTFSISGSDRLSWLHDISTQDFIHLATGEKVDALILNGQGHILHAFTGVDDGTTFHATTEPGHLEELLSWLERMVFRAQVTVGNTQAEANSPFLRQASELVTSQRAFVETNKNYFIPTHSGLDPNHCTICAQAFAHVTNSSAQSLAHVTESPAQSLCLGVEVRPSPTSGNVSPGIAGIHTPHETKTSASHDAPHGREVAHVGWWAREALRIAHGIPRIFLDTDEKTIPNEIAMPCIDPASNVELARDVESTHDAKPMRDAESTRVTSLKRNSEPTRLGSWVHLKKGCYPGQEVVARVFNVGRPPRRLTRLLLDGSADRLPEIGSEIRCNGQIVGRMGTSAIHYEQGPIGLALLKRSLGTDEVVEADGIAASQEVIVDPEVGLHITRA